MHSVTVLDLLLGPAVAFAAIGVLVVVGRWINAPSRPPVNRRRRLPLRSEPLDYGLLVSVASFGSDQLAQRVRTRLRSHGIRATAGPGPGGTTQVLVFPGDVPMALAYVRPESSPDRYS